MSQNNNSNTQSQINQVNGISNINPSTSYVIKSSNSLIYDFKNSCSNVKGIGSNGINNTIFTENQLTSRNKQINLHEEDYNNATNNVEIDNNLNNISQTKITCKCKKSNCLKLYCACIANEQYCTDCNCVSCKNVVENDVLRNEALKQIKQKNPNAFKKKGKLDLNETNQESRIVIRISKDHMEVSCKCSNSGCIQRYCECFKNNLKCSKKCNCKDCKNLKGASNDTINNNNTKQENELKVKYIDITDNIINENYSQNRRNDYSAINVKKVSSSLEFPDFKNNDMGQIGIIKSDNDNNFEYDNEPKSFAKKLIFENIYNNNNSNSNLRINYSCKIDEANAVLVNSSNFNNQSDNSEENDNTLPKVHKDIDFSKVTSIKRVLRGKNAVNYLENSDVNNEENSLSQTENIMQMYLTGGGFGVNSQNQKHTNSENSKHNYSVKFFTDSNHVEGIDANEGIEIKHEEADFKQRNENLSRKRHRCRNNYSEKAAASSKRNERRAKEIKDVNNVNKESTKESDFKTPLHTPDINQRYSDKTNATTGKTITKMKIIVPKYFSNLKKNLDLNFKNI